jgi:hypothetical protein
MDVQFFVCFAERSLSLFPSITCSITSSTTLAVFFAEIICIFPGGKGVKA